MTAEFTSGAIKQTGEIRDALGRPLYVGHDCGAVVVYVPGTDLIYFDQTQQAEFLRLFSEAGQDADRWVTRYGGPDAR